jgi:cytochrome c-type biogenesis protein CcmE
VHVNKRARTRLIGVTAVILIGIAAVVLLTGNKQGAVYSTVPKVAEDPSLVGKRVKVGGTVVEGSWDKQSNPMTFVIRDESDKTGSGPTLKVVYTGGAPSTFGDGVVAIVTGVLEDGTTIKASEMITKCPSKYESAQGAIPIADLLLKGDSVIGKPVRSTGYVKAGSISDAASGTRFVVAESADGAGKTVAVAFTGALPSGMKDGSQVVIAGELNQGGTFTATSVALEESQK